jgi:hypothetical protein
VSGPAHMVELGLQVSLVAPLVAVALRGRPHVPPVAAWLAFVGSQWLFHASPALELAQRSLVAHALLHAVLLATAVVFWAPVVAGTARTLYLFLALPAVDGIALWFLADGREELGVAMLAGMLPLGAAVVVAVWLSLVEEERALEAAR